MTLTEIRNAVISRMTAQTAIAADAVDYPNGPLFDPSGRDIWARFTNISGTAGANEIGAGPVVHRTGVIIIQIFVPIYTGTILLTQTADQLTKHFEFQNDGRLSYFAVSAVPAGEADGWSQLNLQIPYRAV
jgi:hypothetical protein